MEQGRPAQVRAGGRAAEGWGALLPQGQAGTVSARAAVKKYPMLQVIPAIRRFVRSVEPG